MQSIQRLLPHHFQILDMVVAGHEAKTIAQALDKSVGSVNSVIRSPLFQLELTKRRAANSEVTIGGLDRSAHMNKAMSLLEAAGEKAANTLTDLLEDKDPSIQLRSANSILDRVFHKTGDERNVVVNITAENLQLLQVALKESSYVQPNQRLTADSPDAKCSESSGSELRENCRVEDRPADEPAAERAER